MADPLAGITDEELEERLARFGHTITTKGKMTDAQRQIQKKKLNHLEAKEKAEKEKAEKEAAKKEKEAAKKALGSPPPPNKRARVSRRRTVAITSTVIPEESVEETSVVGDGPKSPLKSPLACKDKAPVDVNLPETSPLKIIVVDSGTGRAAGGVPLTLSVLHATKGWFQLAERRTDNDGECPGLITKDLFQGGLYRIRFDMEEYYKSTTSKVNFPQIEIAVHVEEPGEKYTVSIMLMPYGYTSTVVRSNPAC